MSKSAACGVSGRLEEELAEAKEKRYDTKNALRIRTSPGSQPLSNPIANILAKEEVKNPTSIPITVNYNESFDTMVQKGNYDFVDKRITAENFPIRGSGTHNTEVSLDYLSSRTKSDWAIKTIEKRGYVPCMMEHFLALGAARPDLQQEYPIICFAPKLALPGTGLIAVPALDYKNEQRRVILVPYHWKRNHSCRFATVLKPKLSHLDTSTAICLSTIPSQRDS